MANRTPLEELAEEHLLARTRRALRAQVGIGAASDEMIADAIGAATVTLVRVLREKSVDNLGGYFFRVAKNELLSLVREAGRHVELAAEDRQGYELLEGGPSGRSEAEAGLIYEFLLALLDSWAARREADVVRLVLEAAYEGVEMTTEDYLEAFDEVTGQPITTGQFYDLKSRGMRRMRRDVIALAAQDGLEPSALIDG